MKGQTPLAMRAEPRDVSGKQVKHLRKAGFVPASVYRHGGESLHVSVDAAEFERIRRRAGTSSIVELQITDTAPMQVLFHNVERHPISGHTLHAALIQVRMTEVIAIEVPLRFLGESPAMHDEGAALITQRDHVRVEALPASLPSHIDVDLSVLRTC